MADLPDDLVPLPTAPWVERPTELPLDVEECRTALWLVQGNVAQAAELIKVPSKRLRAFVSNNEYLKREMEEAKEIIKDIAEGNVVEALRDRQDAGRRDTMAKWYLERQAKDRGYGNAAGGINVNKLKGNITISWDIEDASQPGDDAKIIDGNAVAAE